MNLTGKTDKNNIVRVDSEWKQWGPLKGWSVSARLHGTTTQKTAIFVYLRLFGDVLKHYNDGGSITKVT